MLVVGEHAGSHIAGFSNQVQSEFVSLLSGRSILTPFVCLFLFLLIITLSIGLKRSVCEPTRSIKSISLTRTIFI